MSFCSLFLLGLDFSASKISRPRPRPPNSSILSGRSVRSIHNFLLLPLLLLLILSSHLLLLAILCCLA